MHHPTDRIVGLHVTDFAAPVVGHWLEREIAQWVACCGALVGMRSSSMGPPAGIGPKQNRVITNCHKIPTTKEVTPIFGQ